MIFFQGILHSSQLKGDETLPNLAQQHDVPSLIHNLYNSLAEQDHEETAEIRDVLLRSYRHLPQRDPIVVANKLANYIHFIGYTEKITFTDQQDALVTQLSQAGQRAGLNGSYRAWYGDKNQF
ncbi:bacteriocin immunity protein [Lacticaseibacillus daqingensis]|uniref:bacteriocin immunity protein n=1 Tax=Lacticaseibacillus daqingensis TaxID=2486014 RepID=UPI001CDB81EF|nr:bacteriocin immunity protein [Lacticaseibacillus daqingensis]